VLVETYVVRVWLPDRPGALGQVASRIGAVRGDVIGIDILERGGGSAIDELTVSLPESGLVDLLVGEIRQVDGVAVEDVRPIDITRPDAAIAPLGAAARLIESPAADRHDVFCAEIARLVDGDWCAIVRLDDGAVMSVSGSPPDLGWLGAFFVGSRHLDESVESVPGDIAWGYLDAIGAAAATGRRGRPFHARERQQLTLLCRILVGL
jgi:hypothetical protein